MKGQAEVVVAIAFSFQSFSHLTDAVPHGELLDSDAMELQELIARKAADEIGQDRTNVPIDSARCGRFVLHSNESMEDGGEVALSDEDALEVVSFGGSPNLFNLDDQSGAMKDVGEQSLLGRPPGRVQAPRSSVGVCLGFWVEEGVMEVITASTDNLLARTRMGPHDFV